MEMLILLPVGIIIVIFFAGITVVLMAMSEVTYQDWMDGEN